MTTDSRPFDVVFLCTGNRFRSPIAAALFTREAGDVALRVESLGLLDLGEAAPLPEALELGAGLGLDLSRHRARKLLHGGLDRADLVLGFERKHVVRAVVDGGAAPERTFTLPELVDLLERIDPPLSPDPVQRARKALAAAQAARPPDREPLLVPELPDPLGQSPAVFRETADRVRVLTERLADLLFGAPE